MRNEIESLAVYIWCRNGAPLSIITKLIHVPESRALTVISPRISEKEKLDRKYTENSFNVVCRY